MITDWDDAYANAAHIPGAERFPPAWAAAAAAFRARVPPEPLRYGAHARETLDLFRPAGAIAGLMVFVHGGYWRAFDRTDWSHLAEGALARGWAVAMPSYVLAPEARIAAIGRQVAQAIAAAAEAVPGPIRLAGHSAGGHLVTRAVCRDGLPATLAGRVERVVPISGLHDLRPLIRTAMNADLGLDLAEARAESPALLEPLEGPMLHAWVGAEERPEFIRQTRLIATIWAGLGVETATTIEPGRHHFDVIAGLADPNSALSRALLD